MATKTKYPYDDWFGTSDRLLVKGRDFECSRATMTSNLRRVAKKRGLKISVWNTPVGLRMHTDYEA